MNDEANTPAPATTEEEAPPVALCATVVLTDGTDPVDSIVSAESCEPYLLAFKNARRSLPARMTPGQFMAVVECTGGVEPHNAHADFYAWLEKPRAPMPTSKPKTEGTATEPDAPDDVVQT